MTRSPWVWIPSLYFGQGIPYVVVMTLSVVMYKNLGFSNTDIALYTSWLYLPWVIKPLWSPLAELFGTKRLWVTVLQFFIGAALAGVALTLPMERAFQMSLAVFWLMAFASASHDIAADGYYMLALPQHQQAAFVGVRSTFYRLANIGGQGGLVYLAGELTERTGSVVQAWTWVFWLLGGLFVALAVWHALVLPRPAADVRGVGGSAARGLVAEFFAVFASYFRKPGILVVLAFLLLYRFPEAQLLKLATPFLLDPVGEGGLGLSTKAVGIAYGTVGLTALTLGGLAGGWVISRVGLKKALWPLVLAMHIPNVAFLLLALTHPTSLAVISAALAVEQFGYGLGFTAYLMYMIHVADGPQKTAHYAICTGFMALGMMIPGMWSGWLQDQIGYVSFFIWVLVATIPSFAMTALIKVPEGFGKKADA
ncbi:MFS transporter [Roseateles asaccharophilus]|uniref:PAT family beta-lactamase induction signal transducer AmpG n=1 Tax=Roseateles asaccharophilus TaxID=582607 RepID=A0ABU2AD45_9BURK|nr:MFS transporter [Roseateles asaccharophilus]MDR7335114.1 PAT family beta-lactamase induction signal transducer AmpG [Roseateles asaccharophilus]